MRQSYTAVVARNETWQNDYTVEPYEAAWASEAIYFIRTLEATSDVVSAPSAYVEISPDGVHWCREGTTLVLSDEPGVSFCRVTHFGGWLRLRGTLPDGATMKVIVYLTLKE